MLQIKMKCLNVYIPVAKYGSGMVASKCGSSAYLACSVDICSHHCGPWGNGYNRKLGQNTDRESVASSYTKTYLLFDITILEVA